MSGDAQNIEARAPKGFRDTFAGEVRARRAMVETIREVYEKYGFEPLETPAVEYLDALGKYLPEADLPDQGVFAFRDEKSWVALRYDLTAPLSRVVAQYAADLPLPFRRYQFGPVWRQEKVGPGRYREFYQCDIDTVGTASMAADAEVCAVLSESLEALGIPQGDYVIRVNNRKVLTGVLETAGIAEGAETETKRADGETIKVNQRLVVLRTMDKLDRLGLGGLRELLGEGRMDESGDFTPGAHLSADQADQIIAFMQPGTADRGSAIDEMAKHVGESAVGAEGIREIREIDATLTATGFDSNRVIIDPSVVRGLDYYTGPVYEAELTFEVTGDKGKRESFGSVAGGGRYDDLVKRFTGQLIPATGASIGIDRLLAALEALGKRDAFEAPGPVMVAVLDPRYETECQKIAAELRQAGITAEAYLGAGKLKQQLKYADRRKAPVAILVGEDEIGSGEVSIKDLLLGSKLSAKVTGRDEWRKGQPAQVRVKREVMIEKVREILARND
jgi:histidyl-tRNA synthetase